MKFRNWIARVGGPTAVARCLGVSRSAVYVWLGRRGSPNVNTQLAIVTASGNRLTFNDIMRDTIPARGKKRGGK